MILLVHILTGLLLLVMQTTVLPALCSGGFCYDLLIPFVIHLGRTFSPRWGVALALGFGLFNDSLSGGIFGLYLSAYFWILMLVCWLLTFLHARSSLIWPFIVALGVLVENGVILILFVLTQRGAGEAAPLLQMAALQFTLAVLTGPLVLRFFSWATRILSELTKSGKIRDEP